MERRGGIAQPVHVEITAGAPLADEADILSRKRRGLAVLVHLVHQCYGIGLIVDERAEDDHCLARTYPRKHPEHEVSTRSWPNSRRSRLPHVQRGLCPSSPRP